tara:strand:- start:8268 stop:8420 length:153 start_codon:yes stop_codon:yes gene_type:complete
MLIQYFKNAKKNKSSYPEELKSVLNKESIVLLFGTEGATDPDIFRSIIES